MGAGKTTVLKSLRKLGIACIDEPARQILAEQRAIEGSGVPDQNPQLFTDLLLSRSICQFKQMENYENPVVYDRGIPDNIAYADLFNLDKKIAINAANHYQYNKHILFLPACREIYKTDDERKMTFDQALQFGNTLREIYKNLGYSIIELPIERPNERAVFIQNVINTHS